MLEECGKKKQSYINENENNSSMDTMNKGEDNPIYHIPINTPNRYTIGTSLGLNKGLNTNLQQWLNNQFANNVWQSR